MSTSPISLNTPSSTYANSTANSQSSSSTGSAADGGQAAVDALGNPDTFLQLLVAQLQYQDPESPADGTAFVTQLATFSGVEEQSAMRGDLDSINSVAQQYAATLSAPATTTASTSKSADTGGGASNPANNNTNATAPSNTTGASN